MKNAERARASTPLALGVFTLASEKSFWDFVEDVFLKPKVNIQKERGEGKRLVHRPVLITLFTSWSVVPRFFATRANSLSYFLLSLQLVYVKL
jgi:hypothetical protein